MNQNRINIGITGLCLIILIILIPKFSNAQKVTKLFEKEQYEKALQYCLKQKGEKQKDCFKELADAYLGKEDFENATEFYAKSTNPNAGYLKIADKYFERDDLENAAKYYARLSDSHDGFLKIANAYFEVGEYYKAEEFFSKAGNEKKETYDKIIKAYFEKEQYNKASSFCYKQGDEYEKVCFKVLADTYFNAGKFWDANFAYKKLDLSKEDNLKIGNKFFEKEQYHIAVDYFEEINHLEGLNNIAEKYFELGQEYINLFKTEVNSNEFKIVFSNIEKLRDDAKKEQQNLDLYNEYSNKQADTENLRNEYKVKSQEYKNKYNDYKKRVDVLCNSTFEQFKDAKDNFTAAKDYFKLSAKYYVKAGTKGIDLKIANALFDLGTVISRDELIFIDKMSIVSKAGEYYEKANADKNTYYKVAQILYNLGIIEEHRCLSEVYMNETALKKAGEYFEKAEAGNEDFYKVANACLKLDSYWSLKYAGEYYEKADASVTDYNNLADAFFNKEMLTEAFKYYQKANKADYGFKKISKIAFASESFNYRTILDMSYDVGKQNETFTRVGNLYLKEGNSWDALELFIEIMNLKKLEECYVVMLKNGDVDWFDDYFKSDKLKISALLAMDLIVSYEDENIEDEKFQSSMKSLITNKGLNLDFFEVLVIFCVNESLLNSGEGDYASANAYNNYITVIEIITKLYGSIL